MFELQNVLCRKSSKSYSENYAIFGMTSKERLWDSNCLMEELIPKEAVSMKTSVAMAYRKKINS